MNTTYLHCLIGLQCQFSKVYDADVKLIIDVKPESDTLILLNDDGTLSYSGVTSFFLTEKSQNKLVEKIYNKHTREVASSCLGKAD
jgi:hypothetical protein